MKNFFLLLFVSILFFESSFAQSVGINNEGSMPNPSAMLDINSANKGLLVPRVVLTGSDDITTIPSPAISLLVYNTATVSGANNIIPGYYYWNGSAWLILTTGVPEVKKDNADSISNTGFATVYSRNKVRDSLQANINTATTDLASKKDIIDSVANKGYATVYSRNKARDSVQANLNAKAAIILLKKDITDSISNTGYATVYSRNKARDSVQINLNANTANILLKKDNADSISNTGYATVYSRNKARDSVQTNLNVNTANILLKKDNADSISNSGYATVYSRNKARDSVQTNLDINSANILLKKDNVDSIANSGYATVYSRNKSRDSVQANLDINTANILLKKDNVDSVSNSGYATVYSRNKARDSVQANLNISTANTFLKKDNSDSTNSITGYTTLYQNSLKEAPLTFAAGLTRTGNTITNDLSTGISGGQILIGSTSPNSGITYVATSGASTGITGADHVFKVGDNGSIEAMRIVSDSLGYVGIGTTRPTTVLHIKKNIPPINGQGANTVLKIQNGYGAGNFGFNSFGGYWQNSANVSPFGGGFNIYNLGGSGFFGIQTNGNVGIGTTGPSAFLQIKAGTSGTAPFKLTSGTLLSSPQAGAIEFNTDSYYATITTGSARRTFAFVENLTKNVVGLSNVDNTSDVNKPVSSATQTALDLKWGIAGNSGTNTTNNFIGTTDNTPFNIRVNNLNAGRIDNTLSNTFWGYRAGNINTTGTGNTAIGANTLLTNITGVSNTAVGNGANVSVDGLTNATAIGNGAIADASNKIRLGNTNVTVIEGQVAYSFPSDARFKYHIQKNVPGLDFIKKLEPVTYYFDAGKLAEYTKTGVINNSILYPASYNGEEQLHTGFLAQDVEKIANELGYDFDGVHAPMNNKDHYSLAYSQFIMPLVQSVQEQQKIIENQNKKIDGQAEQIKKMNEQIEMLSKAINKLSNISTTKTSGR